MPWLQATPVRLWVKDLVGERDECSQDDIFNLDRGKLTLVLILLENAKLCLRGF